MMFKHAFVRWRRRARLALAACTQAGAGQLHRRRQSGKLSDWHLMAVASGKLN
jgi:hypothetical protein